MSEYKPIKEVLDELSEIVEDNEIDINGWITIDDCLYITEYLKEEIPPKQVDMEWVTVSHNIWVCSVVVNDGDKFLHFTFRVYDESEPASKLLN